MSEIKTNKISSLASNNDITLDPDGTGDTIIASGNVGIGTTSPSTPLEISSTSNTTLRLNNTGTNYWDIQNDSNLRFSRGGTEHMRIDSSGSLLVNTTSRTGTSNFVVAADAVNANPMSVVNTRTAASTDYAILFYRAGSNVGSIQTSLSATSYVTSSDYRLKENVTATWDATTRLKQLNPVRFNFIADADTTVDGFLAHEVQTVVPEAISGTHDEVDDDGNPVYQGIDQSKLVPLLVKTIQELEARIVVLENA